MKKLSEWWDKQFNSNPAKPAQQAKPSQSDQAKEKKAVIATADSSPKKDQEKPDNPPTTTPEKTSSGKTDKPKPPAKLAEPDNMGPSSPLTSPTTSRTPTSQSSSLSSSPSSSPSLNLSPLNSISNSDLDPSTSPKSPPAKQKSHTDHKDSKSKSVTVASPTPESKDPYIRDFINALKTAWSQDHLASLAESIYEVAFENTNISLLPENLRDKAKLLTAIRSFEFFDYITNTLYARQKQTPDAARGIGLLFRMLGLALQRAYTILCKIEAHLEFYIGTAAAESRSLLPPALRDPSTLIEGINTTIILNQVANMIHASLHTQNRPISEHLIVFSMFIRSAWLVLQDEYALHLQETAPKPTQVAHIGPALQAAVDITTAFERRSHSRSDTELLESSMALQQIITEGKFDDIHAIYTNVQRLKESLSVHEPRMFGVGATEYRDWFCTEEYTMSYVLLPNKPLFTNEYKGVSSCPMAKITISRSQAEQAAAPVIKSHGVYGLLLYAHYLRKNADNFSTMQFPPKITREFILDFYDKAFYFTIAAITTLKNVPQLYQDKRKDISPRSVIYSLGFFDPRDATSLEAYESKHTDAYFNALNKHQITTEDRSQRFLALSAKASQWALQLGSDAQSRFVASDDAGSSKASVGALGH